MEKAENVINPDRTDGEDQREFFLTSDQHTKLAKYLNRELNLPFIKDEAKEEAVLRKVVIAADRNMMKFVPSEILDGVNDPEFELDEMIAMAMKDNLVPLLADLIPLPFIPAVLKRRILEIVVDLIVNVIASHTTLDDRIEEFLRAV